MLARIDLRGSPDVRARARAPAGRGRRRERRGRGDHRRRARAAATPRSASSPSASTAAELDDLAVPRSELAAALDRLDPGAAGRARARPRPDRRLARGAARREPSSTSAPACGSASCVVPVDRAGCYVPGGRAPLASSVLMTALPARVAGVPEVALCTPPRPDGTVHDAILAAAALAGVDEVYRGRRRAGDRRARVRHRDASPRST